MKNNWLIVFLLVVAFPNNALAQRSKSLHLDSLISKSLSMKQDTNLVNTWGLIIQEYTTISKTMIKGDENYTEAMVYADKYLALAKRLKWIKGIYEAYIWIGHIAQKANDITTADGWYKKAYYFTDKKNRKAEDILLITNLYTAAAKQFYHPGAYDKAREVIQKPQKFLERIKDTAGLSYIYQDVAETYLYASDYDKYLLYMAKAVQLFNENDRSTAHVRSLVYLADAYHYKNDLVNSLEALQRAQVLLANNSDNETLAGVYNQTSSLYRTIKDYNKALAVDKLAVNAISLAKLASQKIKAYYINTEAYDYELLNDYDTALKLYNQSLALSIGKNDQTARTLELIASVYYKKKNYLKSFDAINQGIKIYKKGIETGEIILHKGYENIDMTFNLGLLYLEAPDSILTKAGVTHAERYQKAEQIFNYNLQFGKLAKSLSYQQDAYEKLSDLYLVTGETTKALENYKLYIIMRDSIDKQRNQNQFISKELQFNFNRREDSLRYKQLIKDTKLQGQLLLNEKERELQQAKYAQSQTSLLAEQSERKENQQKLIASQNKSALADKTVELQKTEIQDKRKQTYYLFAGVAALVLLSFFIASNYLNQRKANAIITNEKQRSDNLLLNILPADVAEELKEKGSANARLFDEVTVLFTDFVNFTTISELLTPQELVDELHHCFKAFDGIMTTHHIEKIKTIGDAYLAVAGLPNADANHAANTVKAALAIQAFIHQHKQKKGDKAFDIRIGVHSGSVVAGIVGVKKFAYDIWGDTVNTAARMEQNSEPGKINISEKTYELVKNDFTFTYRGEIAAKNKGMMKMYFVG